MIIKRQINEKSTNFTTKNETKSADESMAFSFKSSMAVLVQSSAFSKSDSM
jgi:hypothetical protein